MAIITKNRKLCLYKLLAVKLFEIKLQRAVEEKNIFPISFHFHRKNRNLKSSVKKLQLAEISVVGAIEQKVKISNKSLHVSYLSGKNNYSCQVPNVLLKIKHEKHFESIKFPIMLFPNRKTYNEKKNMLLCLANLN